MVRYRLATGRWRCVVGLGLTAAVPPTAGWPAETLAWAAAVTWPDAVIGHRVAGVLHGFPISVELPVDVYVRDGHRAREGLVAHRGALARADVTASSSGLTITSVTRTAIDCLSVMTVREGLDLYAWPTSHGRLDRACLTAAVVARTGCRGVGTLRELQRLTRSGAASEAERRMHAVLRQGGITGWEAGVRIRDAEGIIGVVDLCFAAQRVVVEIDGREAHSAPAALLNDRRRQNRLMTAGYVVLRFTWSDIVSRPDAVLELIRRALERRTEAVNAG